MLGIAGAFQLESTFHSSYPGNCPKSSFGALACRGYVQHKKLSVAASTQIQEAKTAKVHFEPQNTGTAIRIEHQCL